MPLVIGADEAGYGPNLGPLVVAASAWRVPVDFLRCDWYARLGQAIARDPTAATIPPADPVSDVADPLPVAIADSKQLYSPSTGMKWLERGVLAAWGASARGRAGPRVLGRDWRDLWRSVDPGSERELQAACWREEPAARLPACWPEPQIVAAESAMSRALERADVQLVALRARGVFPAEFNRAVLGTANKAELLSLTTLGLVRELIELEPDEHVVVSCDKHGGRNGYAALLQHVFPGPLVQVRNESAANSRYGWRDGARTVEIEFRAGGESQMPVALASMTAKYLRELSMRAFNAFWQRAVPGLRATAGYPVDARRFKQDIAVRQAELGIADEVLWRIK